MSRGVKETQEATQNSGALQAVFSGEIEVSFLLQSHSLPVTGEGIYVIVFLTQTYSQLHVINIYNQRVIRLK